MHALSPFSILETTDPFTGVFGSSRGSYKPIIDIEEVEAETDISEIDIVGSIFDGLPKQGLVAIKGHAGKGKSMFAATLAHQMSHQGLQSVYIDTDNANPLDMVSRCPTMNMSMVRYVSFGSTGANFSEYTMAQLIRSLPEKYFFIDSLDSILKAQRLKAKTSSPGAFPSPTMTETGAAIKRFQQAAIDQGATVFLCADDSLRRSLRHIPHTIISVDCQPVGQNHQLKARVDKSRHGKAGLYLSGERDSKTGQWKPVS